MSPSQYRHAVARAASLTAMGALVFGVALVAGAPAAAPVLAQSTQERRPARIDEPALPFQQQQQEGTPLIVVDGKALAPTAKLDLGDKQIGSIELLKPADAVKKFGQSARFGAVVVTTRAPNDEEVKAKVADALALKKAELDKMIEEEKAVSGEFGAVAGQILHPETGEPVSGAQVMIGNRGALTNPQGRFIINNVPAGERYLDVRLSGFVGRQPVQVLAREAVTIDVFELRAMSPKERTKFDLSTRAKSDAEIVKLEVGKLLAKEQEGGASGVTKGNPIIVIDGMVMGQGHELIKRMDPSMIESIEIVKGAAAAALYGERAGEGGVISIKTKKR